METKKKVPTLNKVAYGIGTGGGCIFNQIAAAFLLNLLYGHGTDWSRSDCYHVFSVPYF